MGHLRPRDEDQLADRIVEWLATPHELRQTTSLVGLGKALGVSDKVLRELMAKRPEIAHRVLAMVGIEASTRVSALLDTLFHAAQAGSIRAAEVYLEWVRKVVQDERYTRLLEHSRPLVQVNQVVTQTAEAGAKLLKLAEAMGGKEDIARRGRARVSGALLMDEKLQSARAATLDRPLALRGLPPVEADVSADDAVV